MCLGREGVSWRRRANCPSSSHLSPLPRPGPVEQTATPPYNQLIQNTQTTPVNPASLSETLGLLHVTQLPPAHPFQVASRACSTRCRRRLLPSKQHTARQRHFGSCDFRRGSTCWGSNREKRNYIECVSFSAPGVADYPDSDPSRNL